MKDLLDVHTHTIASVHAYSTLREMITAAKEKGLELIGIADHAQSMPGAFHEIYFCNFKVIRLKEHLLSRLDYAIASLHDPCIRPGTREQNTAALIGAMRHPTVKIIGHPDTPVYPVDFDKLAQAACEHHVLLEINNSSYTPGGSRTGSRELAGELLAACKKYGTTVILGSDAHIDLDVGNHTYSQEMIAQYDFPEELVINSNPKKFRDWIAE